jgi:D-alanyl-D-alanine carboxypeptidase
MPAFDAGALPAGAAARLERMVEGLIGRSGVRHAIVAVGDGAGSPIWAGAAGAAGAADGAGAPMGTETPFFLASVTKLYIATAALRLLEEGRLALDAPLAAYLPADLVAGLHRTGGVDRTAEITVRHLLGHASGLPEYLLLAPRGGASLFDEVVTGEDRGWGIEDIAETVRRWGTPYHPPRPFDGRRHSIRYSDTNFQLLITIIEALSGQPVHDAFDTLIYRRVGLTRTFHPGTPAADRALADAGTRPATPWAGDRPLDELPLAMRSFNDLFSTAGETLRFMGALVTGRAFDDPATARLMTAHWNPLAFSLSLRPVGPGWPMEYGLGILRFRLPRVFTPFRPMPPLVGHSGVTGSWLFHCPDLDLILSGTVDQATAAPLPYRFLPRLVRELTALGIRGSAGSRR